MRGKRREEGRESQRRGGEWEGKGIAVGQERGH